MVQKGSGSSCASEGLRSLKLSPRGSRSELRTEGEGWQMVQIEDEVKGLLLRAKDKK